MILQVLQRHSLPTVDCMLPQLSQPKLAIHPEMLGQTHFARANLFCGVHGTGQQRTDLTVNLRGLQAAVNIAVQEIPFARGFLTRSLRHRRFLMPVRSARLPFRRLTALVELIKRGQTIDTLALRKQLPYLPHEQRNIRYTSFTQHAGDIHRILIGKRRILCQ